MVVIMNSLVVFYSRTEKTEFVAEEIAKQLDSDVETIIDKKDRDGIMGWIEAGVEAIIGAETEIEPTQYSPSDYDLIILGSPVWSRRISPAMRTYLNDHDLSDRKIALFNTNDSDETQNIFDTMKELAENQSSVGELVLSKVSKNDDKVVERVRKWTEKLKAEMAG